MLMTIYLKMISVERAGMRVIGHGEKQCPLIFEREREKQKNNTVPTKCRHNHIN